MGIDIIAEIKDVVDIEIAGLLVLKDNVNMEFKKAVEAICNCEGKVILMGMGKSGIIAQKISSTMSSTGTPSIFLHPAEGMHGDLGIVAAQDIVIAIGKSGESDELKTILPQLKKMGVKIIAITANGDSELARLSDIVLDIGDAREACPFNLATTSSTTATLVVGDAIAITLMKMKEFKVENFAFFHPGGRLGKRLTLTVEDIMLSKDNNPVINVNDTIKNMILIISEKHAGAASVVDDSGRLLGLVTDYDIRKHLEKEENIFLIKISEIMNPNPAYIQHDAKAFDALKLMQERTKPITVLPVVDRDKVVVGILRLHDLVKVGLQ